LRPGTYGITVQTEFFRTLTRNAIVLDVGDRLNLDFRCSSPVRRLAVRRHNFRFDHVAGDGARLFARLDRAPSNQGMRNFTELDKAVANVDTANCGRHDRSAWWVRAVLRLGHGEGTPVGWGFPYVRISYADEVPALSFNLNSPAFQTLPFNTTIAPTTSMRMVDDFVPEQAFWIPDVNQPGGRILNLEAFAIPSGNDGDFQEIPGGDSP
jgi:hypothetical protein